jgi:hypothetical protein
MKEIVLDMDSSVSQTYGSREGFAYEPRGEGILKGLNLGGAAILQDDLTITMLKTTAFLGQI